MVSAYGAVVAIGVIPVGCLRKLSGVLLMQVTAPLRGSTSPR